MASRPVHVVPHEGEWATRREVAQREKTELFIHGKDGRIRDRDSFGNDPFPPRDHKH